jgi:tetratricopeptide (TPR) repeat protein
LAGLPPNGHDAPAIGRTDVLRTALGQLQAGAFDRAAALIEPLHQASPDLEACLLLGLALGGSGRPDRAAALLNAVAQQRPDAPHPAQDLVRLLRQARQPGAIEAYFVAAQACAPEDPRLAFAMGEWLKTSGQPDAARRAFAQAVSRKPDFAAALVSLAMLEAEAGCLDEASARLRAVLVQDPARLDALTNLGVVLATQGRFAESFAQFEHARRLAPGRADIAMNHGHALLKAGRLREGWAPFNRRLEQPGRALLPAALLLPPVEPGQRLDGKVVVVTYDSGFGDTLQFARYLPRLAAAGAQVLLWVPEPLRRLLATMPGVARVLSGNVTLPRFDWHCPIIQLAQVFGTAAETIPADCPYLAPDPALVAAWSARLPAVPARARRIGLAWAGAAKMEFDRRRSMALAAMAPLATVPGVQWISLQMGEARHQPPPPGLALHDPMGAVQDFADTAAIIASLDVVVSVDTAVVHLAGAMGKPVILLDRYDNCWRWMTQREDSPWYPSVRIIRQARWGEWDPVMKRAAERLMREA